MANELYTALELSPDASSEDIKKAYYRLIRKYSPEKYPEQFKQIREAYDTLSDPKARENYNSLQEYGDEIQNLFDQVQENMQAEEWSSAIPLLKRIIILAPSLSVAQNKLGICLLYEQKWNDAAKVYYKLIKENPDIPLYWYNFGQVYKQQANSLDSDNSEKYQFYQKARKCFEKAIGLESFNSEHYLEIAQTYFAEDNYYEANIWAERAISADGKVDIQDLDTLFFICKIHLCSGDIESIEVTAKRIISLLPDSGDARTHAAYKFYNLGLELVKIGASQANIVLLRATFKFFKAARDLDPSDADIKNIHERTEEMIAILEQYEILKQDSQIIPGLQQLAKVYILDTFRLHESKEKRANLVDAALDEIASSPDNSVISSVRKLKSYYPAVYMLNQEAFDEIEEISLNNKQSSNPQPQPQSQPQPQPPSLPSKTDKEHSGSQTYNDNKSMTLPQPSYTNTSLSSSSDWRNAVIIGSLIGGAIIIGLALTRTPQPVVTKTAISNNSTSNSSNFSNSSNSSNSSSSAPSLSQQNAKDLIARWQAAKRKLFASPYDQELGAELTTGKAYKDNIKGPTSRGEAESSLEWLRNNNSYYTFGLQKIDYVERFESSLNQAVIEVIITEERTLYNNKGQIDKEATGLDTRLVRYTLLLIDGKWKIADYKSIRKIR